MKIHIHLKGQVSAKEIKRLSSQSDKMSANNLSVVCVHLAVNGDVLIGETHFTTAFSMQKFCKKRDLFELFATEFIKNT